MNIKDQIKISVVMPVKDRFAMAQTAINSILNQEEGVHELIIVDDGSSELASSYLIHAANFASEVGVKMVFIRNNINKGVSASRNIGFHASTGEIICFCDSDDYWLPQKTRIIKNLFEDSLITILYHSFIWCCGTLLAFRLLPNGKCISLPRVVLVMFSFLNPSCLSLRRSVYGRGFDEGLRYHEDLDFALQLSRIQTIHFLNFPLMVMGRVPGSDGGATSNELRMREGAITALHNVDGSFVLRILAKMKIKFHQIKIRIINTAIKYRN